VSVFLWQADGPELGAARNATARAFRTLEDEGLLERVPGIGYIVQAPAPP
jgi:DNA-binding transcriptional regulator YhcF (GntR family)